MSPAPSARNGHVLEDGRPSALEAAGPRVPVAANMLIGREREVAYLQRCLAQPAVRLVTILGAPGAGKTRVCIEVATRIDALSDTLVYFIPLAPIRAPELVLPSICMALGIPERHGVSPVNALAGHLTGRSALLVLDNLEHLVGAGPQLSALVAMCPDAKILATSRASLNVYAEHQFLLPPLPVPERWGPTDADGLLGVPSVALFVQRARTVQHDFALTVDNAATVASLCVHLDGLPLAIELAAARIRHLPPGALLARLEQRFQLLNRGPRDAPERQRTLRAAIDWSYNLLNNTEQRVFRQLAVFAGGSTAEATTSVCQAPGGLPEEVPDAIARLIEQSLVVSHQQSNGEPRFSMLETIREYALEQLAANSELEAASERLAHYATTLAERAEPELIRSDQREWLDRLDQELSTLRAALSWCIDRHRSEPALRMGRALWRFWATRGYLAEGLGWLCAALQLPTPVAQTRLRIDALHAAGNLARDYGDSQRAIGLHEECLSMRRELGDIAGVAASLGSLGGVERLRGNYERAIALHQESLALRRQLGDEWGTALQITNLAWTLCELGRHDEVLSRADEGISLLRRLGDRRCLSRLLNWVGVSKRYRCDLEGASMLHNEALDISRNLGDRRGAAHALNQLGCVAREQGDLRAAHTLLGEAFRLYCDLGNQRDVARCLTDIAQLGAVSGNWAAAVRAYAAADAAFETSGPPVAAHAQSVITAVIARARATLGESVFCAQWNEGRALPPRQTAEDVLKADAETPRLPVRTLRQASTLTRRERQVAILVARGLTDRQIAAELIISERTAGAHIEHILAKLGMRSRAQVATWVTAHGLLFEVRAVG